MLCPWNVSSDVKYLVLTVGASMTVYELLVIAGKHFNEEPVDIVLECANKNGGQAIGTTQFCMTLSDLNIEDGEEMSVRSVYKTYKSPPLIKDSTKKFTRRALNVFKKIFSTFANEEGVMELKQVINFFNACNDVHHAPMTENDVQVHNFFEDNDDDHDGKITEDNFVKFYERMSIKKKYLVTQNLRKLKFGEDLMPIGYKQEVELSKLPRYTISNHYLSDLFEMGS